MRISLRANDVTYPLAGAAGVSERVHTSAGDFEIVGAPEIEEIQLVDSDYALVLDRGNLLHRLRFTTSKMFDTPSEAQLWCLDYDSTTPRAGTLWMDAIAPNGAISRRAMANAVVRPPTRRVNGATALLDYEAMGGAISSAAVAYDLSLGGSLASVYTGGPIPGLPVELPAAADNDGKPAWSDNGSIVAPTVWSVYWTNSAGGKWKVYWFTNDEAWSSPEDVPYPWLCNTWTPETANISGSPAFNVI